MKKRFLLALCIAAMVMQGCGAESAKESDYESATSYGETADYAEPAYASDDLYTESEDVAELYNENSEAAPKVDESGQTTNRKLIKNVSMDVETEEFDKLLSNLEASTLAVGGYIEASDIYNGSMGITSARNASMTLRIPATELDSFLDKIGEQSNVTRKSESVRDVTLDYVDLDSHKKALLEEQERLMDFLSSAVTMDEIITLESRLSEVRYQIESMESQIRTFDNQVDYSTVSIEITEVKEYTPIVIDEPTMWERIHDGFLENWEDLCEGFEELFIWLVINSPAIVIFLLFMGGLTYGILELVIRLTEGKSFHRWNKERKAAKKEKKRLLAEGKLADKAPAAEVSADYAPVEDDKTEATEDIL